MIIDNIDIIKDYRERIILYIKYTLTNFCSILDLLDSVCLGPNIKLGMLWLGEKKLWLTPKGTLKLCRIGILVWIVWALILQIITYNLLEQFFIILLSCDMEVGEFRHDKGEEVGGHGHTHGIVVHHILIINSHVSSLFHVRQGCHVPK